jgi:hypothetical protein
MNKQKLNVFGQPDDIKQALYSSWCKFEEALCMTGQRQADMKYSYATETTEQEFLALLAGQLREAREVIDDFAPEYYRETLEDWAQAAAEANHP